MVTDDMHVSILKIKFVIGDGAFAVVVLMVVNHVIQMLELGDQVVLFVQGKLEIRGNQLKGP